MRLFVEARRGSCPTCETIESLAHKALNGEIGNGNIGWTVADYTTEENQTVVEKCRVLASKVVLVDVKDGEILRWKNLEKVWDYAHDPKAFEDVESGAIAIQCRRERGAQQVANATI